MLFELFALYFFISICSEFFFGWEIYRIHPNVRNFVLFKVALEHRFYENVLKENDIAGRICTIDFACEFPYDPQPENKYGAPLKMIRGDKGLIN